MAARINTDGCAQIVAMLATIGQAAQGVAAMALYRGAGIMADEISREIQGISTAPFKYAKNGEKRMPSPEEKAALMAAPRGVAKFRKNGAEVQTRVGFNRSGYVQVNWNHMSGKGRTNYKVKDGAVKWSGKAYLERGADGHAFRNRGAGGLQNAKPVDVIANSINSGTSFMEKQPFFRKAVNKAKNPIVAAMEAEILKRIDDISKQQGGT